MAKKPTAKKPTTKKPAAKKPVVKKKPTTEKPATKKQPVEPAASPAAEATTVVEADALEPEAKPDPPPAIDEGTKPELPPAAPKPSMPLPPEDEDGLDIISIVPIVAVAVLLLAIFWQWWTAEVPPDEVPETTIEAVAPVKAPAKEEDFGAILAPPAGPVNEQAEDAAKQSARLYGRGDFTAALSKADAALRQVPGEVRYERLRAYSLHQLTRNGEALEQLNQAVQHDSRSPDVYRQRAAVNQALGRGAEAERDMLAFTRLSNGTAPTSPP